MTSCAQANSRARWTRPHPAWGPVSRAQKSASGLLPCPGCPYPTLMV